MVFLRIESGRRESNPRPTRRVTGGGADPPFGRIPVRQGDALAADPSAAHVPVVMRSRHETVTSAGQLLERRVRRRGVAPLTHGWSESYVREPPSDPMGEGGEDDEEASSSGRRRRCVGVPPRLHRWRAPARVRTVAAPASRSVGEASLVRRPARHVGSSPGRRPARSTAREAVGWPARRPRRTSRPFGSASGRLGARPWQGCPPPSSCHAPALATALASTGRLDAAEPGTPVEHPGDPPLRDEEQRGSPHLR